MSNWGTGGEGGEVGGLGSVGRRPGKGPFDEKVYARGKIAEEVAELRSGLNRNPRMNLGRNEMGFVGFSGYTEGVHEDPAGLFEEYRQSLGEKAADLHGLHMEKHNFTFSGQEYPMNAGEAFVVVPADKYGQNVDFQAVAQAAEGFEKWLTQRRNRK